MLCILYIKVAATVRAKRDELPTMPSNIAKITGEYMASHDWKEVGKWLTL
jgi:hypothetical protein